MNRNRSLSSFGASGMGGLTEISSHRIIITPPPHLGCSEAKSRKLSLSSFLGKPSNFEGDRGPTVDTTEDDLDVAREAAADVLPLSREEVEATVVDLEIEFRG